MIISATNHGIKFNQPLTRTGGWYKCTTHPAYYLMSCASTWARAGSAPLLIAITGSNKDWQATHDLYRSTLDSLGLPFTLAVMANFSNGGNPANWAADPKYTDVYGIPFFTRYMLAQADECSFDQDGCQAIMADNVAYFKGSGNVYVDGFSGGGHLLEMIVFSNPEYIKGFVGSACNYVGRGITSEVPANRFPISTNPARLTLPGKYVMQTGDPNSPVLTPQMNNALALMASNSYNNVVGSIQLLPGSNHDPNVSTTLPYLGGLL